MEQALSGERAGAEIERDGGEAPNVVQVGAAGDTQNWGEVH